MTNSNINTTATSDLREAIDLLHQTESMISFVQSITLLNEQAGSELSLDSDQVSGLYYVLDGIRSNLRSVGQKMGSARVVMNHD